METPRKKILKKSSSDYLRGELTDAETIKALRRWAADERAAWLAAVQSDPLLPERLLPEDYLGRRAWERRKRVLHRTGKRLRTFAPQPRDHQNFVAGATKD